MPSRRRIRIAAAIAVVWTLAAASRAGAQSVALFGGYEWPRLDFENAHLLTSDWNGWQAGAVVSVAPHVAIVGRVEGLYGTLFNTGIVVRPTGAARPFIYTTELGARYILLPASWITPFVEAHGGVAHGQVGTMGVDFVGTTTDTKSVAGVGGGATVRITPRLAVQGAIDYERTSLFDQRLSRVAFELAASWKISGR